MFRQLNANGRTACEKWLHFVPFTQAHELMEKKVLNVGGNNKAILPPQYAGFQHLMLDIDPRGSPDIVCDARMLSLSRVGSSMRFIVRTISKHYHRHECRVRVRRIPACPERRICRLIRVPDARGGAANARARIGCRGTHFTNRQRAQSRFSTCYTVTESKSSAAGRISSRTKTGFTRKSCWAFCGALVFQYLHRARQPGKSQRWHSKARRTRRIAIVWLAAAIVAMAPGIRHCPYHC